MPPDRVLAQAMGMQGVPLDRFSPWLPAMGWATATGRVLTHGEFQSRAQIRGILERDSDYAKAATDFICRGRWVAWNLPVRMRDGRFYFDSRGTLFLGDVDPLTTPSAGGRDLRFDFPWAFGSTGGAFETLPPADRAIQLTLQRACSESGFHGVTFRIEREGRVTLIDVLQQEGGQMLRLTEAVRVLTTILGHIGLVGQAVTFEEASAVRGPSQVVVRAAPPRVISEVGGPDTYVEPPEDSVYRLSLEVLPRPSLPVMLNEGWRLRDRPRPSTPEEK